VGDLERENRRLNDEMTRIQQGNLLAEPADALSNSSHSNDPGQAQQPFANAEAAPSFIWQLEMSPSGSMPHDTLRLPPLESSQDHERTGFARSVSIAHTSDASTVPSDPVGRHSLVDTTKGQGSPTVALRRRQSSAEIVIALDRLIYDDVGDAGEVNGQHGSYLGRGAGAMHICDDIMSVGVAKEVEGGRRQKLQTNSMRSKLPQPVGKVPQPEHTSQR
jgi:hypothetical protein